MVLPPVAIFLSKGLTTSSPYGAIFGLLAASVRFHEDDDLDFKAGILV